MYLFQRLLEKVYKRFFANDTHFGETTTT